MKRELPQSEEAERIVLGCMLTSTDALTHCSEVLQARDFFRAGHKIIFEMLHKLCDDGKIVDVQLCSLELGHKGSLVACGGVAYLVTLAGYAGTSADVEAYVEIVRHRSLLRQLIHASEEIINDAYRIPEDIIACIDAASKRIYDISKGYHDEDARSIRDIIDGPPKSIVEVLEERQSNFLLYGNSAVPKGWLSTGYIDLDNVLGGLGPSHFIVLAARPAMGKTALLMNIAESVCFDQGKAVGIFSLEMGADQLVQRVISSQGEVPHEELKKGSFQASQFQHILTTIAEIQDGPMYIDDQPGLKVTTLRSRARRMKELYDIKLLVIDYLQLIEGSGTAKSQENRQIEVSEISRTLKTIARELEIPVLCAAQLSRKVEERTDHRPLLSDLRESGAIEQDSDQIIMLTRPEYYDKDRSPGLATVIVGKNRHGTTGEIQLVYRANMLKFLNYNKNGIDDECNF